MSWCRFAVDPGTLPQWVRNTRRNWVVAIYLGRARDPDDAKRVRAIYRERLRRSRRGEDVVVDHIEPLCSDWVCGLHHSSNLRIVARVTNAKKSNGALHPELELPHEPHQTRLL